MLRAEEGQAPPPLAAQVRRGHPARLACPPGVGKPRVGEGTSSGGRVGEKPSDGSLGGTGPHPPRPPACRPPDPVARPLPGSSRRGRPSLPGLARVPPAHTHRDTEATILRGGRSGCGLLGLHRATAATSGNRGEEAPAASSGPDRGPGTGDPQPGAHPAAPTCLPMSQRRTRSRVSPQPPLQRALQPEQLRLGRGKNVPQGGRDRCHSFIRDTHRFLEELTGESSQAERHGWRLPSGKCLESYERNALGSQRNR